MALSADIHGKGTNTLDTSQTESVTVAADATILFAFVAWQGAATLLTNFTHAGGAMTQIGTTIDRLSGTLSGKLYVKISPTTGTNNFVATFSSAPGGGSNIFWLALKGGDTSTGHRTTVTRTDSDGTGPGTSATGFTSGDYVVHCASVNATTITWDAGETVQESENITGSGWSAGLSYKTSDGNVGCTDTALYGEYAVAAIPGGSDVTTALSGSASTGGHGTQVPNFQIPL